MASEELFKDDFSPDPLPDGHQKDRDTSNTGEQVTMHSEDIPVTHGIATSVEILPTNAPAKDIQVSSVEHEHEAKLTQLPMARIRNIMKLDPDLQVASNEAVFAVSKAVELFIESLARESYTYTAQAKKKVIQKKDVDLAISAVDSLMFLDGAMNF